MDQLKEKEQEKELEEKLEEAQIEVQNEIIEKKHDKEAEEELEAKHDNRIEEEQKEELENKTEDVQEKKIEEKLENEVEEELEEKNKNKIEEVNETALDENLKNEIEEILEEAQKKEFENEPKAGETVNRAVPKKSAKKKIIIGIIVFILLALIVAVATVCVVEFTGKPIFQMIGEEVIELEYGSDYEDKGFNVYTKFQNINDKVKIESNVDTSKVGTYYVKYNVPTNTGFDTYTRTVVVKDTTTPILNLEGENTINIEYGNEYEEPGYSATDNCDGDLTEKVVITKVDLENGGYEIHYSVEDSSSNKAEKIRYIKVTDSTPPVIKLNGNSVISIITNSAYVEQGAIATDNKDGDITKKIIKTGEVDVSKNGKYTITYTVTDNSGNKSSVKRTVIVGDTQSTGVIYLTFDDGPSTSSTPRVLDILKEKGVHATFFIINYSEKTEDLVKREINEGHAIGIHGYSHDYAEVYKSVDTAYDNIIKLQDKIYKSTGKKVMITRFPGGSSNTVSKKYCAGVMSAISKKILEDGFKYYDWNVSSEDAGGAKTRDGVYNNVIKGIKPGRNNIVLMHDFSGNNKTIEALPDIIDYGLANGYKFEVITEDTEMITQRIQN